MEALSAAKYFIKNGLDAPRNTYDGNMKVQKLLFFSNFINWALHGEALFSDPVMAFTNGCVVEDVRLRYKNDFASLLVDSTAFDPNFDQKEYDSLNLAKSIFGRLSAKELSEINHQFDCWRNAYSRSLQLDGFKDKSIAIISDDEIAGEVHKIKSVIDAYNATKDSSCHSEIINGVEFFYDPSELSLSDDVIDTLENFAKTADERAYTVYRDEERLVIY